MNIFYLDHNIELCAKFHNNKHLIKQILESMQLISITLHVTGFSAPYKLTHINHPCAVWTRQSGANLTYLENLFLALCEEYTYRYGKIHACEDKWRQWYHVIQRCIYKLPDKGFTSPVLCMPDQYKTACPVESYRLYCLGEKSRMFKWKNREIPYWVKNYLMTESNYVA